LQFTKALAAEWAGSAFRSTRSAPGAFVTDAQAAVLNDEAMLAARLRKIPGRSHGQVEEFGPLVCYLPHLSNFMTRLGGGARRRGGEKL